MQWFRGRLSQMQFTATPGPPRRGLRRLRERLRDFNHNVVAFTAEWFARPEVVVSMAAVTLLAVAALALLAWTE